MAVRQVRVIHSSMLWHQCNEISQALSSIETGDTEELLLYNTASLCEDVFYTQSDYFE